VRLLRSKIFLAGMLVSASSFASNQSVPSQHKMKNGLEVITVENHKVPLVTIVLTVRAGAMTERVSTNGLTHLWEHMFFKGNAVIPDQEAYNRRIRQLGIVFNGDTAAEKVRYYFTMPSAFLEEGVKFMYDAISTPKLDKAELAKERRVVMDEYDRSAAQPGFDRGRLNRAIIYGAKSYLRDPLGERDIISKASRKQLLEIKDRVFVPKNSAIIVGGDVSPDQVVRLVHKYFKDWKNPKGWKRPSGGKYQEFPKRIEYVMTRPNVQGASVFLQFKGPTARKNLRETFVADIFLSMLGNRTTKFYKKMVDSGLTQSAGLHYPTQNEVGELILTAESKAENALKARQALLDEMVLVAKGNYFTQDQLDDIKRALLIQHQYELNAPSEFTKSLGFWWAITGIDYYNSYLKNMNSITLKDLQKFAKKYLVNKNYVSSILLNPKDAARLKLKDTSKDLMKKHAIM
jgi:zinc protease